MLQMASERLIVWIVGSHIDHRSAAAYDSGRLAYFFPSHYETHLLKAVRAFHLVTLSGEAGEFPASVACSLNKCGLKSLHLLHVTASQRFVHVAFFRLIRLGILAHQGDTPPVREIILAIWTVFSGGISVTTTSLIDSLSVSGIENKYCGPTE